MKHVGKQISTNDKIVLLFREVPGEPGNCLVTKTETLSANDHESLMQALESLEGQQTNVLADHLHVTMNRAGRPILESLHRNGKIVKLPTNDILLTPEPGKAGVPLSQVNAAIEESLNNTRKQPGALSDNDIATSLRSQAAGMQKEAERLLAEAEELSPTKKARAKKATAKKTTTKKATKARASA